MSFHSAASSAVWIFGRYSTIDEPSCAQLRVVVDDVEHQVDDRRREAGAVGAADVAVVEMQAARAEDLGREVELLLPVAESIGRPKNRCAHWFISPATSLGDVQEQRIAMDRQLQVALVVERHRRQLAERVLAVEHPAVGAGQQRVGDVADAALDRAAALGAGPGALNPLRLQVGGNLAAGEAAGARVRDADVGPRNRGVRVEKRRCAAWSARARRGARCGRPSPPCGRRRTARALRAPRALRRSRHRRSRGPRFLGIPIDSRYFTAPFR